MNRIHIELLNEEYPIEEELEEVLKEYTQLKSILTELEEWLKEEIKKHKEYDKKNNCEWVNYNSYYELLDKIQELNEKYK